MFAEKARNIQKAGAIGGIVIGKERLGFCRCTLYFADLKILES